jgi:hypothetical protein
MPFPPPPTGAAGHKNKSDHPFMMIAFIFMPVELPL